MSDVRWLRGLFSPFRLKNLDLANRFIMPAMQRQWCENGGPTKRLNDYYMERVRGGVSLLITESCAVDHPTATDNPLYARMNESSLPAWQRCVEDVKAAGGNFMMQLFHEGAVRQEPTDGTGSCAPVISPSGLIRADKPNGRAATLEELEDLKQAYVRSALMAREAGFDGVELHGAHGFLLDQFLWSSTNQRTDRYGGSLATRAAYPAEIIRAVREAVGPDFVIGMRISQWKEVDYEARIAENAEELSALLKILREAGLDLFHASARRFWTAEWPSSPLGFAGWVKKLGELPVIAVGSVGLNVDVMDNFFGAEAKSTGEAGLRELALRFENEEFDLVAVGRGLIGDPKWVKKVQEGRFSDIKMFEKRDLLGDADISDFNPNAGH